MGTLQYKFDTITALNDLRNDLLSDDIYHMTGRKLVVIEAFKGGDDLCEFGIQFAHHYDLPYEVYFILAEDGLTNGRAVWIGDTFETIRNAISWVAECGNGTLPRMDLQSLLGDVFGYSKPDVLAFSESELGQTCQCDLCGGPDTVTASMIPVESKLEADIRKARTYNFGDDLHPPVGA